MVRGREGKKNEEMNERKQRSGGGDDADVVVFLFFQIPSQRQLTPFNRLANLKSIQKPAVQEF